MSNVTILATGRITAADQLSVELVQPTDAPMVILIKWPGAPSVTSVRTFPVAALTCIALLDDAMQRLANIAGEL